MRTNCYGKRYCKIVLTGGPCAGKTTAQKQLQDMIADNYSEKWQVFTVAEASSVLYKGGVQRQALDPDQIIKWQEGMLNTIFQFEKVYENIAAIEKKRDTIIICDRGGMDPKVFTQKPEEWPQLLEKLGITEQDILDRYEAVIQLFTAPEEYYSVTENPHRRETFQEATEINKKYGVVWKQHPNFHQIDNYDHNDPENKGNLGWEGKFLKVWAIVEKILEK